MLFGEFIVKLTPVGPAVVYQKTYKVISVQYCKVQLMLKPKRTKDQKVSN